MSDKIDVRGTRQSHSALSVVVNGTGTVVWAGSCIGAEIFIDNRRCLCHLIFAIEHLHTEVTTAAAPKQRNMRNVPCWLLPATATYDSSTYEPRYDDDERMFVDNACKARNKFFESYYSNGDKKHE